MDEFRNWISRWKGNDYIKRFSCLGQYLFMTFARLTFRESFRGIETCLDAVYNKLYHSSIRAPSLNICSIANPYRIRAMGNILQESDPSQAFQCHYGAHRRGKWLKKFRERPNAMFERILDSMQPIPTLSIPTHN